MELVKRNIVSIIFGVIALIALVALFVPLGGMEEEFQADLKKQAQLDQNIASLLQTPRVKPIITGNQQPEPLPLFPSKNIIEKAKGVTDEVRDRSFAVLKFAEDLNKAGHTPLVSGALPTPADTPTRVRFRVAYNAALTPGQKPQPYDPGRPNLGPWNIPDDILRAAKPPTDQEIIWALQTDWKETYEPKILRSPPPPNSPPGTLGTPYNATEVLEQFRAEKAKFAERFRRDRSLKSPIYLEPGALNRAQNMDPGAESAPSVEDMWYAQMALWVQQDVALAIKEMNKDSNSVLQSPVKHLLALDVNQGFAMYEMPYAQGGVAAAPTPPLGPDGQPLPAASAEGELPKVYTRAFTGRVCNPMYDVVHFRLVAVVEARYVRQFIQMLEQGRLVTALEVDMKQEDLTVRRYQGYDYGTLPVVEVSVVGEALYLRDWTAHAANAPMPQEVKRKLGVQPKPSEGGAPAGTVASGVNP